MLPLVYSDGTVYLYTVHGDRVSSFSLGPACKRDGVAECHFWPTGLVARTTAFDLWYITSFDEPRPVKMPDSSKFSSLSIFRSSYHGLLL
jgi:hypothetical protein